MEEQPLLGIPPHARKNQYFYIGGVVVVAVVALIVVLTKGQPAQAPVTKNTNVPIVTYVPTPTAYSDFIGTVTSIQGSTIVVAHQVLNGDGTISTASKTATIAGSTELATQRFTDSGPTYSPLSLRDMKAGDKIHVFAAKNIGDQSSFTASKLYRIVN